VHKSWICVAVHKSCLMEHVIKLGTTLIRVRSTVGTVASNSPSPLHNPEVTAALFLSGMEPLI
jgi:hypothetical protein